MIFLKKVLFGACLMVISLATYLFANRHDGKLHLYFLDVGQGDSIFVEAPSGEQILIDGGSGNKVIYELAEIMPFFDRSIDWVVLTHPDMDHVGGLIDVLKRYEVEKVLITGVNSESSYYIEFLKATKGAEVVIADGGEFNVGNVEFDILYPFENVFSERFLKGNDSSIVMKMVYEDVKVLLTGDVELDGEIELLEAGVDLRADILKVGHHGSATSSSVEFLEAVGADVFVIQCGKDNRFKHPHKEVLDRLKSGEVFRTDLDGRVEFVF